MTAELYEPAGRKKSLVALPEDSRYQAEILSTQLDALVPLLDHAEAHLQKEARKVPSVAYVATVPGFGVIRAATLVAATITPARFRTTRQFWSYSGLAIVTRSSADWVRDQKRWVRAEVNQTRGLNRNRHPWLKNVLKGAATTVTIMTEHPLHADYERLLRDGTKPNLAKLTIARRLAAAALACWKKKGGVRPEEASKSHRRGFVGSSPTTFSALASLRRQRFEEASRFVLAAQKCRAGP